MCYNYSRTKWFQFEVMYLMDSFKKLSLYLLILFVSLIITGCGGPNSKVVFKRDSVFDAFQNQTTEDAKPRRVGNVVYLGAESTYGASSKNSGGPSFEFEDLKR